MQEFSPLVSIVIPVYNGADYVKEAIDSALGQTYSNIEVIVVNDGSKDNGATREVAARFGDRIRYFEKENGGVATALNYGIKEMKGDYFSWLSHDDRYYPNKIERQINALINLKNEDAVLYSDYDIIDEHSNRVKEIPLPHIEPEQFFRWLLSESTLHGCTLLIPNKCFRESGIFDTGLWTTQDYDLWFRMAKKFSFVHIAETLVSSRVHGGQTSVTMPQKAMIECNLLYAKVLNNLDAHIVQDAAYMADLAEKYYSRGFYLACITAVKMIRKRSLSLKKMITLSERKAKARIHILKTQRYLLKYLNQT